MPVHAGRRGRWLLTAGLASLGSILLVSAFTLARPGPPRPTGRQPAPSSTGPPRNALPRSAPTRVTIPRIGVDAAVIALDADADGTPEVPPLATPMAAGWYRPGASPGEVGNAVIVGHVDTRATGPAVFYRLGELRPGDTVELARQDGTSARFTVDRVESYPKTAFPTELVYGRASQPGLRLVTCGGDFDRGRRSYVDNVVVFATLTAPP
jgi:hypothetical protein